MIRQRMKWLDDERYIRFAGAMLLVSPFFNFFISVANNQSIPDKWIPSHLWAIFISATLVQWIMRIALVTVGILMVRGKSSAWVPVLAILAFTIIHNIFSFKNDFQISPAQAILSLLTNLFFFTIVFRAEFRLAREEDKKIAAAKAARLKKEADTKIVTPLQAKPATPQEPTKLAPRPAVVKEAAPPAPKPRTKPKIVREFIITRGATIEFEGHGQFAEVMHCNENELWLKSTHSPPSEIKNRAVY